MPNVLQILSSNYSGESVNITFSPLTGESQSFENVSLPYNFVNNTFDGNYSLFFPDYNLTHKFQIPTTDPTNTKCRCTEFSYNSFLGGTSKNSYRACNGSLRKLTLLNGQTYRDCVRINQYTAGTNTNVSVFGYCDSVNDCIQLTQPVTPTQTRTPTPTLSLTPTYTQTSTVTTTQTPSFTPSVTPTTSVGATGDCMCTTIRNLNNSETNISFNLCKYPDWGNRYVVLTLSPNGETRICAIYNTVSGDNISVSYEYGLCEFYGTIRTCPQPTPTPTPTMTPTPTYDDGQNLILISGHKSFPDLTSQTGIFSYNYLSNTMTYLNIYGTYLGVSHSYNFQTQTGKIWASNPSNGGVVKEYNILNSNLDNELNRIISLTGTGYGNNLTFKDDNTLIKTILVDGERWVAEIDITETNINPITTLKFIITITNSNDDTFLTDLMYTNTGKFIWTNGSGVATLQQYDYETGALEFQSVVLFQPSSLIQRQNEIISIQTAPVRATYNLTTADSTIICPNILCGPTTGPTTLTACVGQNCNLYDFSSYGASSLLINNTVNFVPNQPQ